MAPSLGVEVSPSTCATPARSSAASRRSRAAEWRPDRDGERVGDSCHRELSSRWRPVINYLGLPAPLFVAGGGLISYGPIWSTSFGARPATSIASSRARSRPTCRCRRRPIRAGDQPQDRQGARPRRAADGARARRRGDRMRAARVHHAARRCSAYGRLRRARSRWRCR